MKRCIALLLSILILTTTLCACSQNTGQTPSESKMVTIYVVEYVQERRAYENQYIDYYSTYAYTEDGLPKYYSYESTATNVIPYTITYSYDHIGLIPNLYNTLKNNPNQFETDYANAVNVIEQGQTASKADENIHFSLDSSGYPTGSLTSDHWGLITYNSEDISFTEESFSITDLIARYTYTYDPDNRYRLTKFEYEPFTDGILDSDWALTREYSYNAFENMDSTLEIRHTVQGNDRYTEQIETRYNQNGLVIEQKQDFEEETGIITRTITYNFKFTPIQVVSESVDGLCRLYDYLGIRYVVDDGTVTVEDTYFPDNEFIPEIISPTVPITHGDYTLSDASECEGFYIAYEDNSFDCYRGGGYCIDTSYGGSTISGMFLADDVADHLPVITAETNLVFFADTFQSLVLRPVNAAVSAVSVVTEDGTQGYAYICDIEESNAELVVYFKGGNWTRRMPHTINGVPSSEYNATHIKEQVHPFSGMSSHEITVDYYGFEKGTNVTFGVSQGSKLVEETYPANTTYFDCNSSSNNYQIEDIHYLYPTPTKSGYAQVDFTGIPDGQYIMYLDMGTSYIATVIDLHQS